MVYIEAEFQGGLVEVRKPFLYTKRKPRLGKGRGRVMGFSKRSRGRMLKKFARLLPSGRMRFVTLTFSDSNLPDSVSQSKQILRRLFERLRREAPESSAVWRMEVVPRKSGVMAGEFVPHFHLLIFGADHLEKPDDDNPNYSGWFHDAWESVTHHHRYHADDGKHDLRTDDVLLKNKRQGMYYVSKYCAKVERGDTSLVNVPYLHTGRVWGIFNRAFLPSAPVKKFAGHVRNGAFTAFETFAREEFAPIASYRQNSGFSLFVESAETWFCLLDGLISSYRAVLTDSGA